MVLPNKKNYNDNTIATWALWTFIIMSLLVIIICVVCLIIFSTHYADYKWREVGEIEYIRYPTDFDNGTFMSQKNTEAGWYKEIDNNCNDREASINCKQYEEWPGYSEEDYPYWVREDGVKMLGSYVMVAANYEIRPKGTIIESSLGYAIVCDTGGFAKKNPTQIDVAVTWR